MNFEEILRASSVFIEKMLEALGVLFTEQIEIIFRGFSISNFRNNLKQFWGPLVFFFLLEKSSGLLVVYF